MNLGLNEKEVIESREKYGKNQLNQKNNNSFFKLLIESLGDPIIKILLIALAIKTIFLFKDFDWFETIGILIAVFLASFISSISEYGSNKAFDKLQNENNEKYTNVYRNNKLISVLVQDLVVGDIVKINPGEMIPADGIIIKGSLSLDESFLTGETKEIHKKINDKVYSSSVNYDGNAIIKITSVGNNTYIGSISKELLVKNDNSPLKEKLTYLAKQISVIGYLGAILSSVSFLFMKIVVDNSFNIELIRATIMNFPLMFDYLIYCLTISVTIIIMAVPEGLPMMITLVLSSNMKRMLKDKVLVRKLVGIETSGDINVLLCDKTGTLTEGKLKIDKIITYESEYSTLNEIRLSKNKNTIYKSLLLNNEATYSNNNIIGGNTTDRAIMEFFKENIDKNEIIASKTFNSNNKYSSVTTKDITYYKGACEILLKNVNSYLDKNNNIITNINIAKINNKIKYYTNMGYRVLINASGKDINNLTFISLIIIKDKLRIETKTCIEKIQRAGIKVVMITGDNKDTAINIAKKCNIYKYGDYVLTHDDLKKIDDNDLIKKLPQISVIARALPEDKGRLVTLFKKINMIVGMTGDGVNDAIALKKSDVSFALGSGQEVAKEASDIVILDDNIKSIYNAILYGRTIFKSIRKFITYQLTVNISALILSIVGVIIGVTTPITIIQMLWLNMIMDTFAGLAFSYEMPLEEYMEEKPKSKGQKIINKYMFNQITINGFFSSLICILFLLLNPIKLLFRSSDKYYMTGFFSLFVFIGIINSFLCRTSRINILSNIMKNKVFIFINVFIISMQILIIYKGGSVFRTYGLTLKEMIFVLLLSSLILPIDLIRKLFLKKKKTSIGF